MNCTQAQKLSLSSSFQEPPLKNCEKLDLLRNAKSSDSEDKYPRHLINILCRSAPPADVKVSVCANLVGMKFDCWSYYVLIEIKC